MGYNTIKDGKVNILNQRRNNFSNGWQPISKNSVIQRRPKFFLVIFVRANRVFSNHLI